MFLATFYEPILGGKLLLEYGFTSDEVAYFYSIFTISAFSTSLLLTFFPIKTQYMLWTVMSLVFSVLAVLLMGPSLLLRIPDNLITMGVGIGMLGASRQIYMVVITLHTL